MYKKRMFALMIIMSSTALSVDDLLQTKIKALQDRIQQLVPGFDTAGNINGDVVVQEAEEGWTCTGFLIKDMQLSVQGAGNSQVSVYGFKQLQIQYSTENSLQSLFDMIYKNGVEKLQVSPEATQAQKINSATYCSLLIVAADAVRKKISDQAIAAPGSAQ